MAAASGGTVAAGHDGAELPGLDYAAPRGNFPVTLSPRGGLVVSIDLTVNGTTRPVRSSGDVPLLYVLRDELGLTGAKYGCGSGQCGACTVLLDGLSARSCVLPLDAVAGREVSTLEGLRADDGGPHAL